MHFIKKAYPVNYQKYKYQHIHRNIDYTYRNFSFSGSAAIGTPISNSVTELHTMMRYLEYDFLKDHGLQHFDNLVSTAAAQNGRTEFK
jgi:N12 class adenine-specific DNA methylase